MSTQHIHDLTLRLCQALDQNYNVVNMDSVMSVISSLEGSPVTKEQLEATRLAKFINHLRRRTKDDNLARRAKSLLKKWREMVGIQQQQVVDTSQTKPFTGLMSITGCNTKLFEQYHLRPRPSLPVEPSMNFDTTQHNSNTNSKHICNVAAVTSATNITSDPVILEDDRIQQIGDTALLERQYNLSKTRLPTALMISNSIGLQPTSFQNVLSCIGVADYINTSMVHDGSNKAIEPRQNISYSSKNCIVDPSSHSNSEKSPGSCNVPGVIDIPDSNSCSNFDTIRPINYTIPSKTCSIEIKNSQDTCLPSNAVFSLVSKSKKVKKLKKRKEKNNYREPPIGEGIAVTPVLLNESLYNQARLPETSQNIEKIEILVDREKPQSTYGEIPSLLDNSSMSSIFLPEGSMNTTEEVKSQETLDFSKANLTFTGKFKRNSVISAAHNNLVSQSTQVQAQQEVLKLYDTKSSAGQIPLQSEFVSEIISFSNPTPICMRGLPRKRGRKKGSKGVDSIIAKEGCRTSQRLISPLGCGNKKVKTTKELYAEMQNRKWSAKAEISPPSTGWTAREQQKETSRSTSSCSEADKDQSFEEPKQPQQQRTFFAEEKN